ncbi:MAG: hypothetical protein JWM47_1921 [Acidimicrobiales bacterium]|nr:hypothetical protein [Acidimicrobiales bacterium]
MTRTTTERDTDAAAPARPNLQWWREIAIAVGFYVAYSMVRNTFGAGTESKDIAFRHARGVVKVEDFLGLWFEPQLQQWYLDLPGHGFVRGWNVFYGTAHFFVTIGILVLAFWKAPERYRFLRMMLAGATALALFGFASYTLMPPRLLDADTVYGACTGLAEGCHGYGIIDTIDHYGGIWKFSQGEMATVSNQYAAMPSLHFGWSTWCAIALVVIIGRGRLRWLAFAYPALTLFCILITGNHFWLDAVFGAVALGGGYLVALASQRLHQGWESRRAGRLPAPAGVADTA